MQKARDADIFGILVGTLDVGQYLRKVFKLPYYSKFAALASYLPLISHLRKVLGDAHKKFYTISVGKLNPSKLANFMEIECFVLVACPENSVLETKVRVIVTFNT